jgi:tripartite-type tricarboxylate transporter receptor subunit TctC
MKLPSPYKKLLAVAGVGFLMTAASPAVADAVADFYKSKTVTIVTGGGAGGGFAIAARILGMHWTKHLPGNPEFVV